MEADGGEVAPTVVRAAPVIAPPQLWNRNFSLFFVARATSLLGDVMLPMAITVAMLDAGYGMSGVGYALAAHIAPFVVFVVVGGALNDRFSPRIMMVCSDVARLVLQGALAALLFLGTPGLGQILALLALVGLGSATFQPGVAGIVPRLTSQVQKANAAQETAESTMAVLGPALAGVLLAVASPPAVLAVDAFTYGVSGLCLMLMRGLSPSAAPTSDGRHSLRRELGEGWREFRGRTWLTAVVATFMLGALTVLGPNQTLGYSTIVEDHGKTSFGMVMSVFGLGSVVGGLAAARFRPTFPLRTGAVAYGGVVLAPLTVALGLPVSWVAAGYACAGAGGAFWLVMFHTTVQTHVPVEVLSRVHAFDVAGSLMMAPAGRAAAGPAGEWLGPRHVLLVSACMGVVVCAVLLLTRPINRLPRDPLSKERAPM